MNIPNVAILTTALGVLVILTNAFTELVKVTFPKFPAQIAASLIALILTVGSVCAYLSIMAIPYEWYIIAGSIAAGLFVSYSAQFGYDKGKEIIKLITKK